MEYLETVDQYISKKRQWSEALSLLSKIIATFGLEEKIKWGSPVYTLNNINILGIGAFKHYVAIWFFQGGLLKDPLKVLINGQEGKQGRYVSGDLPLLKISIPSKLRTTLRKLFLTINGDIKSNPAHPEKTIDSPKGTAKFTAK